MRTCAVLVASLALATSGCASVAIFDLDAGMGGFPDAQREFYSTPQPPREPVTELGRLEQVGVNGFVLDPRDDGALSRAFAFDEATPVFRQGKAVSPDWLLPGTEVRVTYRAASKALTRADRVELVEAAEGP